MTKQQPKPEPNVSAAGRRSKNGLLALVGVLAAVAIVVIANYVVYWQYRGLSPDARAWVRYDLTSTRRYSLSPQTRAVLADLTDRHRVVTMLGGDAASDEQQQRIRDLIDEYARASDRIDARHIDLNTDTAEREAVLAEMDAMFAADTESVRLAIIDGMKKVDRYQQTVDLVETELKAILDNGVEMSSRNAQRLTDLHSQYLRLSGLARDLARQRREQLGGDWAKRLASPGTQADTDANAGVNLPDYSRLMVGIQQYCIQLATQTLPDTPGKADQVRRGITVNSVADPDARRRALEAQNTLAGLIQQVPALENQVKQDITPLLSLTPPHRYEDARSVLNDKPCVLITAGGQARLLPADQMFRGAGSVDSADTTDLFVGEEQLTGALISLKLDPPPMVVFVQSNTGRRALSVTGPDQQRIEGDYDHAAKRLLSMDFDVAEWANPLREDPPAAKPGQAVVWVTLPFLKPDSRYPQSLDTSLKQKLAGFLGERMARGDGVLVMPSFNPDTDPRLTRGRSGDPLVALLGDLGIDAQLYQNVSRLDSEDGDTDQKLYSAKFVVNDWPEGSLVGRSLVGIDTYFSTPMPLEIEPAEGVKQTPLVELSHPAMYVQRTVPDDTGQLTPEPDSERDRVLIGAAVSRGEGRLVTIGDATWAMDQILTAAAMPDGSFGPGLADKPGARILYPGNSDLFVNCVCWLAHEEDLIAASARTQDIRRIKAVSPETLQAYRVLLWGAMPAMIFALGLGVWLLRRRA